MTDELTAKTPSKTPAQHVASLVQAGPGLEHTDVSPVKRFMVRVPMNTIAYIESLAEASGRSRNFLIGQLLVVGIQAVVDELPENERDHVQGGWLMKMSEQLEQLDEESE